MAVGDTYILDEKQGKSLNRIDTKTNWEAVNPVLAIGEMGIEKDGLLQNIKVGDGVTPWNSLQYMFKSCPYEVGDILVTMNATDPAVRWPGTTWEVFAPGRVLIGAGKGTDVNGTSMEFKVGATGGEYSHQLTVGELPVVEGKVGCPVPGNHGRYVNGAIYALTYTTGVSVTVQTNSEGTLWGYGIRFGNNEKHQIIQPFSACFLYKRLT